MEVLTFADFKKELSANLDKVNNSSEVLIVSRSEGKSVVIMDLSEYNSVVETFHVTGTEANRKRIQNAIDEMNNGSYQRHTIIEE